MALFVCLLFKAVLGNIQTICQSINNRVMTWHFSIWYCEQRSKMLGYDDKPSTKSQGLNIQSIKSPLMACIGWRGPILTRNPRGHIFVKWRSSVDNISTATSIFSYKICPWDKKQNKLHCTRETNAKTLMKELQPHVIPSCCNKGDNFLKILVYLLHIYYMFSNKTHYKL